MLWYGALAVRFEVGLLLKAIYLNCKEASNQIITMLPIDLHDEEVYKYVKGYAMHYNFCIGAT